MACHLGQQRQGGPRAGARLPRAGGSIINRRIIGREIGGAAVEALIAPRAANIIMLSSHRAARIDHVALTNNGPSRGNAINVIERQHVVFHHRFRSVALLSGNGVIAIEAQRIS